MKSAHSPYKPLRGLFVIIVAMTAIIAVAKWLAPRDRIPWNADVAAAVEQSRTDNRPVLLYFTASWCGPCQRMATETFPRPEVETKLRNYHAVKIDIDADPETAQQYQITGVPTFVLLDKDANVTKRTSGLMSAEQFLAWIDG